MKIKLLLLLCCGLWSSCNSYDYCPVTPSESDLVFTGLARSWDEAMPLGNATVGALVWQRDSTLRLSLDRTDLWDLRPVDSLSGDNFRFSWVKEHIRQKNYLPVQKKLDWPYDMNPAPSKIPGAAIEFPLEQIGTPTQVRLYLNNALCEADWADGTQMQTFVHATEPIGWFVFRNLKTPIEPSIITPVYNKTKPDGSLDPVSGQDLHRLGYQQGKVVREGNQITYHQKGYGDFSYDVTVCWKQEGETLYGTWSVTSSLSGEQASEKAEAALQQGMGYLNTLWNQRDAYKRYTRRYFGTEGMNIPGVCTLTGEPMGGWIQYSMSQTVAAWLAQHFYLQWKYSADRTFLKERAYPFIKDVAIYLEQISEVTPEGVRKLEFSSSPEIFDNSLQAWFSDMTNYDLAMMHFLFKAASELAHELNLADEAGHWASLEAQLPDYDIDEEGCLTFAKGYPYKESHRHFSHAMAIHPLGLIDWSDGEKSQHIIRATLKRLDEVGPDYWTGYSYSWLANMKARAFDGEGAAQALKTFAECFCLKNTFHANGDQTQSGKSRFTYRPFTLEGNFAFAAGIQEMLLQSHTGVIRIFPAIPKEWKDVSFESLRAMGAFLVSARMEGGEINRVRIYSEKGGMLKIARPGTLKPNKNYTLSGTDILNIDTQAGEWIELNP